MTQDDAINLAFEYGFIGGFDAEGNQFYDQTFVEAVTAAIEREREACAKVCETTVWSKDIKWWIETTKTQVSAEAGQQCANAIRARGEH